MTTGTKNMKTAATSSQSLILGSVLWLLPVVSQGEGPTREDLLAGSEAKALAGDPNGYYELGIAYQNLPPISKQIGIPHELEKSLNYMWAGYRMGSAHAAHNLAVHYARGDSVPQDMNLASMLYADAVRLATDKQSRDFFANEERKFRARLFDQEVTQAEQSDYDQAIAGGNKTPGVLVGRERTLFLLNGGKHEDWRGR